MKKIFTFIIAMFFTGSMMAQETMTPTNCAEAAEAALSVSANNELYNNGAVYTIEGYVTSIPTTTYLATNHNITFWMADTQDGGNILEAYRAVCASEEDVPVLGDKVAVTGSLTKYDTTPEFYRGCTFTIIERATADLDDSWVTEEISVAQALGIGYALADNSTTQESYTIRGYVSAINVKSSDAYSNEYKNQSFYVTDDPTSTAANYAEGAFYVYRGKPSTEDEIPVGTMVELTCKIHKYVSSSGVIIIESSPANFAVEVLSDTPAELADVVFTAADFIGQGTFTTGSEVTSTKDGVTITCDKAYGDQYGVRCYKNGNISIFSERKIKKIIFEFNSVGGNYYKGGLGNEISVDGVEWSTTLTSVARLKKILIYYGEVVNTDVFPANSGQVFFQNGTLSATPEYGYHFVQWNDSVTENPRTIELTQDTSFTAIFAKNTYVVTTAANNTEWGTTTGDSYVLYQEQSVIQAMPNYGYHFVRWNDGDSSNPRSVVVTQDTTYTATFAKNQYTITKISDLSQGSISGLSQAEYLDSVTLEATPNYGYHFVQWSDGNITNPRTIELSQDTSFTAIFAKNTYAVTTATNNAEWGTTTGDAYVLYQEQTVIQAMPNYGYHFVRWNDGNSSNPRSVVVTQDTTYTATFAKSQYTITKISDLSQGSISGLSRAEYLDTITLEAMPEYGYKFLRWSDGIKDNPRTFVLTQDTTFTAKFGYTVAGSCGDNNQLTWTFDSISGTLSISGEGTLGSNYTYGLQAPAQTTRLIIEEGVTNIGNYAFNGMGSTITSLALPTTLTNIGNYAFAGFNNRKFNSLVLPNDIITIGAHAFDGASYLQTIYFGSLLEEIGASAFNGCTRVRQMTCLAEITPNVGTDGLTSISSLAELYVPNEYLFDYQIDTNWSRFVLKTIGATEATVTNNDVKVVADDNTATLTWPTNENADSYSIEITKDGVVFCTLIFNANGQLTGIAFAPSRNGQPHAPAATMTANGMQFTVTGLNSGTNYAFSVAAKNGETVLASYSGEFETTGAPAVATDLINPSDNIDGYHKLLRDGQILILRGDKTYTLTGQEVR